MEFVISVVVGLLPRPLVNLKIPARLAPRKCPPAQVCLTHADACRAEPTARATKDLIPCEVLEARFEGDIRQWTLAGLKPFDMDRLISERVKPLQLGARGRQKVG